MSYVWVLYEVAVSASVGVGLGGVNGGGFVDSGAMFYVVMVE